MIERDSSQFVALLRNFALDFDPVGSPAELAATATLSVTGTIEGVEEGRSWAATPDSGPVFFNVILVVRVDQVLGGDRSIIDDEGIIYVEIMRTESETVETYRDAIPENQAVALFLDDRTDVPRGGPVTPAPNVPAGARILSPYAEGFILEDVATGELTAGYVALERLESSWHGVDTLNALTELVGPTPAPQSEAGRPTETTGQPTETTAQ